MLESVLRRSVAVRCCHMRVSVFGEYTYASWWECVAVPTLYLQPLVAQSDRLIEQSETGHKSLENVRQRQLCSLSGSFWGPKRRGVNCWSSRRVGCSLLCTGDCAYVGCRTNGCLAGKCKEQSLAGEENKDLEEPKGRDRGDYNDRTAPRITWRRQGYTNQRRLAVSSHT